MTGLEAVLAAGWHVLVVAAPFVPAAVAVWVIAMRALTRGGALDGPDQ